MAERFAAVIVFEKGQISAQEKNGVLPPFFKIGRQAELELDKQSEN